MKRGGDSVTLNETEVDTMKRQGVGNLQEGASKEINGTADATIRSSELRGES